MKTLTVLLPEALVVAAGLVCLLGPRRPPGRRPASPQASRARLPEAAWLVLAVVGVALFVELTAGAQVTSLFHGGFTQDRFALFSKAAVLLVLLLVVAASDWALLGRFALGATLLAGFGAMVAASATDFAGLWAGLELALLAGVLAAGPRARLRGRDLLLAAGSLDALLLIGLGAVYAVTGTTVLSGVQAVLLVSALTLPLALAVLAVMAALIVRLGLAGVLGPLPAAAAGILLIKLAGTFAPVAASWTILVPALAAAAMIAGALGALAGGGPRSLLGSAALVQLGWIVAALAAPDRLGLGAALFLLGGYLLAVAGAPLALGEVPHGLAGLAERGGGRAAGFTLALLSLGGMPPLAGFFGVLAVASQLARFGLFWLVLLGLFSLALVAYGILRDLRLIFLASPGEQVPRPDRAWLPIGGALAVGALVVAYGIFANPISGLALQGATAVGLR